MLTVQCSRVIVLTEACTWHPHVGKYTILTCARSCIYTYLACCLLSCEHTCSPGMRVCSCTHRCSHALQECSLTARSAQMRALLYTVHIELLHTVLTGMCVLLISTRPYPHSHMHHACTVRALSHTCVHTCCSKAHTRVHIHTCIMLHCSGALTCM